MLGKCSACGTEIIKIEKINGKMKAKFLDNYKEHTLELSNNSVMRVSVCDECKVELVAGESQVTADKIIENHIDFWKKSSKKDAPKKFENIEVVNPNTTLRDFIRKKEKIKREEELNKQLNQK